MQNMRTKKYRKRALMIGKLHTKKYNKRTHDTKYAH